MTEELWLVYGTGTVGTAVAELLGRQKVGFVIAGRNDERLRRVAKNTGSEYRVADVGDVHALLEGIAGVINTAGPFRHTASPLMQACVDAGAHYVDVSNEADVHEAAWSLSSRAHDAGVGVVAGAGAGTWFSERLIHAIAAQLERPVSALLVILPSGSGVKSAGVAASQNAVISARAVAYVDGRFQVIPRRVQRLPASIGPRTGLLVGTGDAVALGRSSGLKTVAVATGVDVPPWLLSLGLPLITARAMWAASPVSSRHRGGVYDPSVDPRSGELHARLVAEVRGADGALLRGRLSSRSGTAVAARTAVAAMATLLDEDHSGTYTAFQVLGDRALGDEYDPVIEIEERGSRS